MPSPLTVASYLQWWAVAAVQTQIVFDEAQNERQILLGVPRLRMDRYEAEVELRVSVEKRTTWEVRVTPLNLGYRISRGYSEQADARVTIVVQQTPLGAGQGE